MLQLSKNKYPFVSAKLLKTNIFLLKILILSLDCNWCIRNLYTWKRRRESQVSHSLSLTDVRLHSLTNEKNISCRQELRRDYFMLLIHLFE